MRYGAGVKMAEGEEEVPQVPPKSPLANGDPPFTPNLSQAAGRAELGLEVKATAFFPAP